MTDPPSDGLGDGTESVPFNITLDVTTLTQQQASEYRHELWNAIYHPGIEFDMTGKQGEVDLQAYTDQLARVDVYLASFPEKI